MEDRLAIIAKPGTEYMHARLLLELGCGAVRADRATLVMDAALHAYDSRRHGSRNEPFKLRDARLKEARRRHSAARNVPVDARWLVGDRR